MVKHYMTMLIAEIGSVHDGSFGNAKMLIEAAASSGADAVKFQTHIASAESLPNAPTPPYFNDESRIDYFNRTAFTLDQWMKLASHAKEKGVLFLSSPFSIEAVDLLEKINISHYKIASGEVSNIPLLERIAATGKPVLLSSGMSSWDELDEAIDILKTASSEIILMQCTSVYPCPPEKVGLNILSELKIRYNFKIGYSDHTQGIAAPIAAATLGAIVIEKHFTFSRLMYGSDAKFASEPHEFKLLSSCLNDIWIMQNNPVNKFDNSEFSEMKKIFEKSIVTACPISKGTKISRDLLSFKKPGDGIKARDYKTLLGKIVMRDLPENYQIRVDDLL
jgi:N-acetylneuraminate synthase